MKNTIVKSIECAPFLLLHNESFDRDMLTKLLTSGTAESNQLLSDLVANLPLKDLEVDEAFRLLLCIVNQPRS